MSGIRSVHLLMEYRADPWVGDNAGDNALHCSAYAGNSELVHLFLDAGMDIDVANRSGWTALRYAYQEGHMELAQELRRLGAAECHGDRHRRGRSP